MFVYHVIERHHRLFLLVNGKKMWRRVPHRPEILKLDPQDVTRSHAPPSLLVVITKGLRKHGRQSGDDETFDSGYLPRYSEV